jgi:hypothetical protein
MLSRSPNEHDEKENDINYGQPLMPPNTPGSPNTSIPPSSRPTRQSTLFCNTLVDDISRMRNHTDLRSVGHVFPSVGRALNSDSFL